MKLFTSLSRSRSRVDRRSDSHQSDASRSLSVWVRKCNKDWAFGCALWTQHFPTTISKPTASHPDDVPRMLARILPVIATWACAHVEGDYATRLLLHPKRSRLAAYLCAFRKMLWTHLGRRFGRIAVHGKFHITRGVRFAEVSFFRDIRWISNVIYL